jgi:hypothetical protein
MTTARKQAEKNVFMADMFSLHDISRLYNVPEDLLRLWTESGHAPHYDIEGVAEPYYRRDEIYGWIQNNAVRHHPGLPIPKAIDVVVPYDRMGASVPPPALRSMDGLCQLAITAACPGVYFLCHGADVVYVGQSERVLDRICSHIREDNKEFNRDRVFFLPCPKTQLLEIEAHYIKLLKPRYNG